jgi:small subunit ribosomal protein S20
MPNTDSAKRALRKMERRRAKNRHERSTLRTSVKKVRVTAAAATSDTTKVADAKAVLQLAIKRLDQSAAKHLIHANKASRDKSRLTKLINKLSAPAGAAPASAPAAPAT